MSWVVSSDDQVRQVQEQQQDAASAMNKVTAEDNVDVCNVCVYTRS